MGNLRSRVGELELRRPPEQPRYTLSPQTLAALEQLRHPDPDWQPPAHVEPCAPLDDGHGLSDATRRLIEELRCLGQPATEGG